MNKTMKAGVVVVAVLLVGLVCFCMKNTTDQDQIAKRAAISHLEKAGYTDIKIVDSGYFTAIPPPRDAYTHATSSLDSITVQAVKEGKTVVAKVNHVGLPTMTIEQL